MNWSSVQYKPTGNVDITIDLPASKSISNRLLILRHLANDGFEIENLSKANDTKILQSILKNEELPRIINCEDAGTVLRFMSCLCATKNGRQYILTGTKRLLNRPFEPLAKNLNELGARIITETSNNEIEQIEIEGNYLENTPLMIQGNLSSQFISGLCLIASEIKNGLQLQIAEPIYSRPYIQLTLDLLSELGVNSSFENNEIRIAEQQIQGKNIRVESDWSSACFIYCLMLLSNDIDVITIKDLAKQDLQGDKYIASLCSQFGIKTTYEENGVALKRTQVTNVPNTLSLENYPDLAVPFIVICAFCYPDIRLNGLSLLQLKESNRITVLQQNLEKFGIDLVSEKGSIWFKKIAKSPLGNTIKIETHHDHRIAMSFALLATLGFTIELDDTECIGKSFPDFFGQMKKLGIYLKK